MEIEEQQLGVCVSVPSVTPAQLAGTLDPGAVLPCRLIEAAACNARSGRLESMF